MLLYFTSGTTGYPKMVLHTQASYGIGHEITARFCQDPHPGDLHWTFSDTGWAKAAWGLLFGQWRMGATVFLWDVRGKPDFERMLRLIDEHRVTTFSGPPTVFRAMVQGDLSRLDPSSLWHVVSAGEPLDPEVMRRWRRSTGLQIFNGYGQTETVNLVADHRYLSMREGRWASPRPGSTSGSWTRVASSSRRARPATAAADEDGYLWFVGRADDVITSSAYRIGPFEVESALVEHPAVVEGCGRQAR